MKEILWQPYAYVKEQFFVCSLLLFSVATFSLSFTGTITDADNRPISKVTVQVKGTFRRALYDNAGKFSVNASSNNVLFLSSGDGYSNSGYFNYHRCNVLVMKAYKFLQLVGGI